MGRIGRKFLDQGIRQPPRDKEKFVRFDTKHGGQSLQKIVARALPPSLDLRDVRNADVHRVR